MSDLLHSTVTRPDNVTAVAYDAAVALSQLLVLRVGLAVLQLYGKRAISIIVAVAFYIVKILFAWVHI